MEYITLKNQTRVPKLGLGTWYLGEKLSVREEEIQAIQTGIENGMTLIFPLRITRLVWISCNVGIKHTAYSCLVCAWEGMVKIWNCDRSGWVL